MKKGKICVKRLTKEAKLFDLNYNFEFDRLIEMSDDNLFDNN